MELTALQTVREMKALMTQLVEGARMVDERDYIKTRDTLIHNIFLAGKLPNIVLEYTTPTEFWAFIKHKFDNYAERREYVRSQFHNLIRELESAPSNPMQASTEDTLKSLNSLEAQRLFAIAMERSERDPNGAVTAARSLLETTCKLLMDDMGESYESNEKITTLFNKISKKLRLHPTQHPNDSLKLILSGCSKIVQGLAETRNLISDAHGQGRKPMNAAPRHAKLAVSAAGAMSTFLIDTHEHATGALSPRG